MLYYGDNLDVLRRYVRNDTVDLCYIDRIAKAARWQNLIDVQRTYATAKAVGDLTVFNVKGNTYRLIARIRYDLQILYVRTVLTHAQYDKGDWKKL